MTDSTRNWTDKISLSKEPFAHEWYGRLPAKAGGPWPSVVIVMIVGTMDPVRMSRVLDSLVAHTRYPEWTIQFVDNGCPDEVSALLKAMPRSRIIRNTRRQAAPANRNRAIEANTADYFAFLDSDVIINDPYWLHKMVALAESDPSIGIVGGGINSCGSFWHAALNGALVPQHFYSKKYFQKKPFECQGVQSHCCLCRGPMLKKIGLFDEGFNPIYGEEADLCLRALVFGFRIYDCLIDVYHLGSTDSKRALGDSGVNALMEAAGRRLAIRWGWLMPPKKYVNYKLAVRYRDTMVRLGPGYLAGLPAFPALSDENGTVNPLYATLPEQATVWHKMAVAVRMSGIAIRHGIFAQVLRIKNRFFR